MVVNYSVKEDSFVPDKPRVWYGKPLANIGLGGTYDITADGKRLAVVMPPPSAEPREVQNHLTVVVNFFDELWQRVAAQAK
jgi:hypothetical protein